MGGKTRIVDQISAIMKARRAGRSTYVEPFIGGGSVAAAMARHFPTAHLSDWNQDLVMLHQAIQDGWQPPAAITREQWWDLKRATEPSALRAFAGFGGSFGGAWFKSYAENNPGNDYIGASGRALLRYRPHLLHATIRHLDYKDAGQFVTDDALVYCDPPYAGTTGYRGAGKFNNDQFWDVVREWSGRGAAVFTSEYQAPEDFTAVWRLKVNMTMNADSNTTQKTEQLFVHTPALERMKNARSVNP